MCSHELLVLQGEQCEPCDSRESSKMNAAIDNDAVEVVDIVDDEEVGVSLGNAEQANEKGSEGVVPSIHGAPDRSAVGELGTQNEGNEQCVQGNDGGHGIQKPAVGMRFREWTQVECLFRAYAKQEGFGITRAQSAKKEKGGVSTKELRSYTFKCECSGKKDTRIRMNGRKLSSVHSLGKKGAKIVTRQSKKVGCPVVVYTTKSPDGDWVIRKAILEHSGHAPTPSMSKYVCKYRQDAITPAVSKKVVNDDSVGIRIPQILRSLAVDLGGVTQLPFNERDVRNLLAKLKKAREKEEGGDANAMVKYFRKMAEQNKNFYHAERYDAIDQLKDVMWVDGRSRAAYKEFSDVVCFDSTYITNKFRLPFAIFVGVNHHGQTILFGCALLAHETVETFEWLFRCWLEAMGGKAPDGLLTDQCPAIRKAVENTMPHSRHRWCLWHILKKFSLKLGSYSTYKTFKPELKGAIYDSYTPEEFVEKWSAVMNKYKLGNNEWLSSKLSQKLSL